MIALKINGRIKSIDASADVPLLWTLRRQTEH
jgi:aerobic-type carbon monoxide dehydrogenase small subunit (CoxS/CutS family)